MTTIFTVGHSRHTAEHFTSLLRAHEIERLVDVRSTTRAAQRLRTSRSASVRGVLRQGGDADVSHGPDVDVSAAGG